MVGLINLKTYYYYIVDRSRHNLPSLPFWHYLVKPDFNRVLNVLSFLYENSGDSLEVAQLVKKHNRLYIGWLLGFALILFLGLIPF